MKNSLAKKEIGGFLSTILIILAILIGLSIVFLPIKLWIALVLGIIFLFLALYQPVWMVILLLAVCPFGKLWETGGISLYELGYSLTFLLMLAVSFGKRFLDAVFENSQRDFSSPLTYPLLTLFFISFVSAIIAHTRGISYVGWTSDLNLILFYGLYFVVFYNFKAEKSIDIVFYFTVIATCVSLIFLRVPIERFTIAVPGLGKANNYALALFFPTLSLALFSKNRFKKLIFILVVLLFLVGLRFSRSRWFGLFGGLAFLFIFLPPFNKSKLLRCFLVFVMIILVYILFCVTFPSEHYLTQIPLLVWERLGSVVKIHTEPPIMSRMSESTAVLEKIRQHPFIGNGLGATVTYTRYDLGSPLTETSGYIHNSYLFFLFKMGIFGLLTFLWLCITFVIYGVKTALSLPEGVYKALVLGFVSAFIATLITSIAAPDITSPIFSIYVGFLFGAVAVIDKSVKKITHI